MREMLCGAHVTVLNAIAGGNVWHWWAGALSKYADARTQRDMLIYFGSCEAGEMRKAFDSQCDLFSRDAKRAAGVMGVEYPEELERQRRSLGSMFFRQEFCCEFVETTDQVFGYDLVQSAFDDSVKPLF